MEHPPKHSRSCSESSTRSDPTGGFRYKEKRSHTPVLTKLHWLPVAALNIFRPSDIQKTQEENSRVRHAYCVSYIYIFIYIQSRPDEKNLNISITEMIDFQIELRSSSRNRLHVNVVRTVFCHAARTLSLEPFTDSTDWSVTGNFQKAI